MNKSLLVAGLCAVMPLVASADSGMGNLWYFSDKGGQYKMLLSQKVEEAHYNGEAQGPMASELHIYRADKGKFSKQEMLVTKAICTVESEPKSRLVCSNAGGPFSGATFDTLSVYVREGKSFKLAFGSSSDKQATDAGRHMIQEFARISSGEAPFGIGSFSIMRCVKGCEGGATPHVILSVGLTGD